MGNANKKKNAAVGTALLLAAVIALGGTFAWQSVSQQAKGEAETWKNPGGRLHDDFSGWYTTVRNGGYLTKDVYVENFGNRLIYARVRLDEYMEIGAGAGLKTGEEGAGDKAVTSYPAGASIDDPAGWATHLPGGSSGDGVFHAYWTWTMGGEDLKNNPEGKTVYMPTFNKNGDSLAADVNGTMDGSNSHDKVQYDDFVKYTVYTPAVYEADRVTVKTPASGDSADRVRNEDRDKNGDYVVPSGAFYDNDEKNTVDEGDPADPANGMYGNGGVQNVNYSVIRETHYATETLGAKVVTMDWWLTEMEGASEDKLAEQGYWVYDDDGWAYWSQPIAPGTATGVLLDKLEPTTALRNLAEDWYYGINAVGQFITADHLGREDGTGFYSGDGPAPSAKALAMLSQIGVETAVEGTLTVSQAGAAVEKLELGETYDLSAVFHLGGKDVTYTTELDWSLAPGAADANTVVDSAAATLTVGAAETAEELTILGKDESGGLSVVITVPVEIPPVTYEVQIWYRDDFEIEKREVTNTTDTIRSDPFDDPTANYYGVLVASDGSSEPAGGTWSWSAAGDSAISVDNNGTVTGEAMATNRYATITATFTPADGEPVSGSFTVYLQ